MSKRIKTMLRHMALFGSVSIFLILATLWALSFRYEPGIWLDDGKGNRLGLVILIDGDCGICYQRMEQVASVQFLLVPEDGRDPYGTYDADDWPMFFFYSGPPALLNFPIWVLILPTLIYPAFTFRTYWQRRKRIRRGLCLACGYDLRESARTCPECGHQSHADHA